MNKLREIFRSFLYVAFLALIVFVVVFIPILAIQNFGWVLGFLPFWIPSILLGILIILLTNVFTGQKFDPTKRNFFELTHSELVGYLFGFVLVFVSIAWFFLPQRIIHILPASYFMLGFFLFSVPVLLGLGETLSEGVVSLLNRKLNSVFYFIISLAYLSFINLPIFFYTESLPLKYYLSGKIFFGVTLLFQILYVIFFHIDPGIRQFKKGKRC